MKQFLLLFCVCCLTGKLSAQQSKSLFELISFKKYSIPGMAPTAVIEWGGKETDISRSAGSPSYFIFLKATDPITFSIKKIWIAQKSYGVIAERMNKLPYVLEDGKQKDTLIADKPGTYWQLKIQTIDTLPASVNKSLAALIKSNELVLSVQLKSGIQYRYTNKRIRQLVAERRQ